MLEFGKVWKVECKEDYDHVMAVLDELDFCAQMCDDYKVEVREREEIARQRMEVERQAKAKEIL